MEVIISNRGFSAVFHRTYVNQTNSRIIGESSTIGDYDDSFDIPGSSFLWVGDSHLINRDEVRELVGLMQYWFDNKGLPDVGLKPQELKP